MPFLSPLSALPTAGNGGQNFAHKSSKRLTRFRKDLRTIEENGTWDAIPALLSFPDREISVALRTVCGSTLLAKREDTYYSEKDLESRLSAVTYILEHCLQELEREEREEVLISGAIACAGKGRFSILRELIVDSRGKNVNVINGMDRHGFSALLAACCGDYFPDEDEKTVVLAESNRRKCIEILLDNGADPENRGDGVHKKNWTALMALAKRSDLESLKLVFQKTNEKTLDVNRTYSNGKTALFVACEWGASIELSLIHI